MNRKPPRPTIGALTPSTRKRVAQGLTQARGFGPKFGGPQNGRPGPSGGIGGSSEGRNYLWGEVPKSPQFGPLEQARKRYRQEKPISAPSQYTGLPLAFSGKLEKQGWKFLPSRGLGDNRGGHWVPPGWGALPKPGADSERGVRHV